MPLTVRSIRLEDAPAFLKLLLALDHETAFMMFEPGERSDDPASYSRRVEATLFTDNQMIFVAEVAEADTSELVGFLGAYGGSYHRNHDTVHVVIGIREAFTGHGLGRRLFEALETWARSWGAHRLELTVMCHNTHALKLYQRMGFSIEGTLKENLKVNGEYIDEYQMSKILGA